MDALLKCTRSAWRNLHSSAGTQPDFLICRVPFLAFAGSTRKQAGLSHIGADLLNLPCISTSIICRDAPTLHSRTRRTLHKPARAGQLLQSRPKDGTVREPIKLTSVAGVLP